MADYNIIDKLPSKFKDKGFKNYYPRNSFEETLKEGLIKFAKDMEEKRSLVFAGNIGTGKTHLAVAVLKNLIRIKRKIVTSSSNNQQNEIEILDCQKSLFLVADEFFQELNDCAISKMSKEKCIINYLHSYDIILLDDLSTDNFTPAKAENLYLFMNRAYLDEKRLIVTTNFTMEYLESVNPRIASRLAEIAVFLKFEGEDYRKINYLK